MLKFGKLICSIQLILLLALVVVEANENLSQLMEVCEEGNKGQLSQEQLELVYEKFLNSLRDEKELFDLVKESRDLLSSSMIEAGGRLRDKYLDIHTMRVCVMYSMVKNVLDN